MLVGNHGLNVAVTFLIAVIVVVHVDAQSAQQKQQTPMTPNITIFPSVLKSDADVQSGMAILQASDCGKPYSMLPSPIGHGQNAESLKYPWMALLVYTDGLGITLGCGGSLITDRYVITAAHCISSENTKLVKVRLGVHNTNESMCLDCPQPIQEIDVEEAIYHKDYSRNKFINDIGLIRLFVKAILNSNVKPICLPITPESQEITVSRMTIAGWGLRGSDQKANILQASEVLVEDIDFCQQIHRVIRITENHLCAFSTCKDDSGGPIFSYRHFRNGDEYYVLYGILSAGSSRCDFNFPSIYTNVISYLPWIAGNLRP